jgi:hypothetical protein
VTVPLDPDCVEGNTVKASPLILSLCAALFALSGCSSPCESVCSSFNDCEITQRANDVDCATFCSRVEQFEETAAATGADTCEKEFDAYISCWETNIGDICNAESKKCDAPLTAWTDCMAKFCAVEKNATDQACVPQDEGPALPALVGF